MDGDDLGSQVSSQRSATSAATSRSTKHGASAANKLGDQAQWFNAFIELAPVISPKFSVLGIIIDYFQQLGTLLSPYYGWGAIIRSPIGAILYAFILPCWDSAWVGSSQVAATVLFWVAFAAVLYSPLGVLIRVTMDRDKGTFVQDLERNLLQVLTSSALLPVSNFFVSGILCQKQGDGTQMLWYEEECSSHYGRAMRGIGIVGLLVLLVLTYLSSMLLHDDTSYSNAVMSRAHSLPVFLSAWIRIGSAIVFQVYIQQRRPYVYAIFLAVVCLFQFVMYTVTLPYHSMPVTRVRAGTMLSLCGVAIVAALTNEPGWISTVASTICLPAVGIVAFGIGWLAPSIRLDSEFERALKDLKSGILVEDTKQRFPLNLPKRDLVFSAHKTLEADLLPAPGAPTDKLSFSGSAAGSEEADEEDDRPVSILFPFIRRVWFSSDIELASRTLQSYSDALGVVAPDRMKAYISRIFTKGLTKFLRNPSITIHFTHFLITAHRNYLALSEVEKIGSGNMPAQVHLCFRAYCVHLRLKTMLNMTDAVQSKMLARTHRLHKDILVHFTRFWDKVLSADSDVKNLAKIANAILVKRTEAQTTFKQLLQRPTKSVLTRFARFLDEVMLQTQDAQYINEILAEDNERKKRAAKSRDSGGSRLGMGSMAGSTALSGGRDMQSLLVSGGGAAAGEGGHRSNFSAQAVVLGCLLLFLLLCGIGLLVFTSVHGAAVDHQYDQLWAAGHSRSLVSLGHYLVGEMNFIRLEAAGAPLSVYQEAKIQQLQTKLAQVATTFATHHNALTFGTLLTTFKPHKAFYSTPLSEVITVEKASTGASFTREVDSLWNIGGRVVAAFQDLSGVNISAPAAEPQIRFVLENGLDGFASAFNHSAAFYEEQALDRRTPYWLFLALIMVVVCLVAAATHGTILFHLQRVRFHHLAALSLFTQIPRRHLTTLRDTSISRFENFENEGGELEVDTDRFEELERRIEEQESARPQPPPMVFDRAPPPSGAVVSKTGSLSVDGPSAKSELFKDVASKDKERTDSVLVSSQLSGGSFSRSRNTGATSGSDINQYILEASGSAHLPGQVVDKAEKSKDDQDEIAQAPAEDNGRESGGETDVDEDMIGEEEEARNLMTSQQQTTIPWRTILVVSTTITMLALLAVGLGFSFQVGVHAASIRTLSEQSDKQHSLFAEIYRNLLAASDAARAYSQTGDVGFLEEYHCVVSSVRWSGAHRESLLSESSTTNIAHLLTMQSLVDALTSRHNIAIYLAALSYNMSQSTMERYHVTAPVYNLSQTTEEERAFFADTGSDRESSVYQASDNVKDASLNSTAQLLAARSLLYDNLYGAHFTLLERYRNIISDSVSAEVSSVKSKKDAAVITTVSVYCITACIVALAFFNPSIRSVRGLAILLMLIFGTIVAGLAVVAANSKQSDAIEEALQGKLSLRKFANETLSAFLEQNHMVESFLQFGDENYFHAAEEVSTAWSRSLAHYLDANSLLGEDKQFKPDDELIKSVTGLRRIGEGVLFSGLVALKQAVWGYNQTDLLRGSNIEHLAFAEAREPNAVRVDARYAVDTYTNTTHDSTLVTDTASASAMLEMARNTLRGQRTVDATYQVREKLESLTEELVHGFEERILSESSMAITLTITAPSLGVASIIMFLVGVVLYMMLSKEEGAGGVTGLSSDNEKKDDFKWYFAICLVFVVAIFLASAVYNAVIVQGTARHLRTLNRASEREWHVLQSFGYAQRLAKDLIQNDRQSALTELAHLREYTQHMERTRVGLYVGEQGDSDVNAMGHYPQHDAFLWGPQGDLKERFRYDCPSDSEEKELTGLTHVTQYDFLDRALNDLMAEVFSEGIDVATVTWMLELIALTSNKDHARLTDMNLTLRLVDQLRVEVEPLTLALIESTERYFEEARAKIQQEQLISYVLSTLALLAPIAVFIIVLRPKLNELSAEEDGTRLLVRMIPSNVQHDVPAISHYVETGQILRDARMSIINEAVHEMSAVALVVIDWSGTISIFSKAAEVEFGYVASEVIGKNIKMLMPPEYSKHHDQYLENYRRTGVKKIIDKQRRVMARRKDGTLFPVEANVREFKRNAQESSFLGYIRNISAEIETERVAKLNEAVSDMASIPVIVLQPNGKIYRVNRAATTCYGYSEKELVSHNIKKIMPSAIAKKHDGFLAEYLRSRVKKVIDTVRHATGRRKNGSYFPVEITVREILNAKTGQPDYYVGYTRDITNEKRLSQSMLANDAAIAISPYPVIIIDSVGTIMTFSPAAEKAFGYKKEDVKGSNVKMLMTAEDAKHHDGYLSRYLKTGEKHVIGNRRTVSARRNGGVSFNVDLTVQEMKKEDGVAYIAYIKDNASVLELESAEERSRAISSQSPQPVVMISEQGTMLMYNKAAERLFGYLESECMGQNVNMLMPDSTAEKHDDYLRRYLDSTRDSAIDIVRHVTAKKKNGKEVPIELTVREVIVKDLTTAKGTRTVFIGYTRSLLEELSLETKTTLQQVMNLSSTCAIFPDGEISVLSDTAANFFGYEPHEVVGKNVKMLMPDGIAKNHDEYLKRYQMTGVKNVLDRPRTVPGKKKNGEEFVVHLTVREIKVEGVQTIFVAAVVDVTHDIRLEDERDEVMTAFGVSPTPIIVINGKGIISRFSDAATRTFGYPAEDIIGKNVRILMPAAEARQHDGYLKKYLKTGVKNVIDRTRRTQAHRRDGTLISIELSVKEVNIAIEHTNEVEEGGVDAAEKQKKKKARSSERLFLGFARDLSQEYVLQQSNQLKDTVLAGSPVPLVQIDPMGIIIYVNSATLSEFGYEKEEDLVGKNVKLLMPKSIAVNHDAYLKKYRETGVKKIVDSTRSATAVRKSGEKFVVEISVREIFTSEGEKRFVAYIRSTAQDDVIRDKQKLGSLMVKQSTTALVMIDQKGVVLDYNPAASSLFGYTSEEVVGQNIKMLQPPDVAAKHDGYLAEYLTTGIKHVMDNHRQVKGKHKDGSLLDIEIFVSTLSLHGQTCYVGYLRDCSESVQLGEKTALSDTIVAINPTPFLIINEVGIVEHFNRAAELEFGFQQQEVIGHNIKMLMPQDIAENHDGYLAQYKQDGVKRVVDQLRHVYGQRKDGTAIPLEIQVREVAKGNEKIFLGFLRSRVKDLETEREQKKSLSTVNWLTSNFIVISPEGTIEEVNTALVADFGYSTPEELVGKNVKTLMTDEVAKEHDGYLERYAKTRVKSVIDSARRVIGRRKNGSKFAIEIHVREAYFDVTEKRRFVAFIRNVEHEAETQMLSKEGLKLLSMSPDGIVVIDDVGTVKQFSRAACEKWGYSQEEVVGRNLKMLMGETFAKEHDQYLARYKTTGVKKVIGIDRTVPATRKDGSEFTVVLRVREIKEGANSFYVGFIRDVTEMNELETLRQRISLASELSALATIVINDAGKIQTCNREIEEIFQYKKTELLGQNINMLMPRAIASNHDGYLASYKHTGKKHVIDTPRTVNARLKDGSEVLIELNIRELKLMTGEVHFIGFIRDIRKEMAFSEADALAGGVNSLLTEGVACYDSTGHILEWSVGAEKHSGFTRVEVLGTSMEQLFPKVDLYNGNEGSLELLKTRGGHSKSIHLGVMPLEAEGFFLMIFMDEAAARRMSLSGSAVLGEGSLSGLVPSPMKSADSSLVMKQNLPKY